MRILFLSHNFPPEVNAPATRTLEHCVRWARAGHDVTVVTCAPNWPSGVLYPGYRNALRRQVEWMEGIRVVRVWSRLAANQGTFRRTGNYLSYMLSATLASMQLPRPDVVIATSPQLLCGLAGYLLARLRRVPFVFEVRDLWPETMVAVGVMKERARVTRGLRALARALYERSQRIVTVGEGYARSIRELYGIEEGKISIIPNGVDVDVFQPGPRENEVRRGCGWSDKFVLMYLGTHGLCHGLESVLAVARKMRDDETKLFVFVGEGAEKAKLKALAAEWKLPNVQFIDQQPRERISRFYAACDVGLVCLRNHARFREVLPSKIFEYLGMERPVLASVDGEARKLVERAVAGTCVPPEDTRAMASAIQRLYENRLHLDEMGRNGRAFVCRHFDRQQLARKYLALLEAVCRGKHAETC